MPESLVAPVMIPESLVKAAPISNQGQGRNEAELQGRDVESSRAEDEEVAAGAT